ncbi:cytochrome P450 [Streptosporangium sp. NPDC001559]|uniref:cytochrome P450 n=1 Tax=Streptosporangium sp. NPDC001559 TaxID=3366187 RepID=UPI0036E95F68
MVDDVNDPADSADLPALPFVRSNPLDLPQTYHALLNDEPVARVRTQAGDVAWLVTGYEEAREAFAERRLGRSTPTPERVSRISNSVLLGGPRSDTIEVEKAKHERMRRLFAPAFSARRMSALAPRIREFVDTLLDDMAEHGPPADLRERISLPLPVLVICELLGVPYADRGYFRKLAEMVGNLSDPRRAQDAMDALSEYTRKIVIDKRENPSEDVFSDLARADVPDEEIAMLSAGLLFAGHETTINQIDYGVLLLLSNPEQRDALVATPEMIDRAVEEILRIAAPSNHGLPRYAHEDVTIGGVTIERGDAVIIAMTAANRDERAFTDPNRFDIGRAPGSQHLGFGYAIHYCIGASLARIEMREMIGGLFRRFPTLTLTVPPEELTEQSDSLTGGVDRIPVTW